MNSQKIVLQKEYSPDYYQPPTEADLIMLSREVYFMISCYIVVLCFVLFNIWVFVIFQKRYKNWLISVFYILSFLIIVYRLCYYITVLRYYAELIDMINYVDNTPKILIDLGHLDNIIDAQIVSFRRIGLFFISADYTKYTLGYF